MIVIGIALSAIVTRKLQKKCI